MTREEFMRQLEAAMADFSEEDRRDALSYYEEYFDEAGPENEAAVIEDLGSVDRVVSIMRANFSSQREETPAEGETLPVSAAPAPEAGEADAADYQRYGAPRAPQDYRELARKAVQTTAEVVTNTVRYVGRSNWAFWIIVLVITFPFWSGVFAGLAGLLVALFSVLLALTVSGAALVVAGIAVLITMFFGTALQGMLACGVALLCIGLGILCASFFGWLLGKSCKALGKLIGRFATWLFCGRKVVQEQ